MTADRRLKQPSSGPAAPGHLLPQAGEGKHPTARRAALADVPALEAVETKVFPGDRLSRRSFRYYVKAETAILRVMKQDGMLAAYSLLAFRKGSRIARLYSIAVDPACEGQGLGRALLKTCEKDARARGCAVLLLEVRIENARAIALYEKNGYTRFDEIEDYYEDGATALRLEKALGRWAHPSPASGRR